MRGLTAGRAFVIISANERPFFRLRRPMRGNETETERLILDRLREEDKRDYFENISHDRKVPETFICRYAETMEEFDFSSYPQREDIFAVRLEETGKLIGIILYFDEKDGACEIGCGIGSRYWNRGCVTEAAPEARLRLLFHGERGFEARNGKMRDEVQPLFRTGAGIFGADAGSHLLLHRKG